MNKARQSRFDFTRIRKLSFVTVMLCLINQINSCTQTALNKFALLKMDVFSHVTQQAFSKARQKIRWEACKLLVQKIIQLIYSGYYETWGGYRALAIDGSKIHIPPGDDLQEYFGAMGSNNTSTTAQASHLYDVLNGFILDVFLEPLSTCERFLALMHLETLSKMRSFSKELILFDRGYPSTLVISSCESKNIFYLMRLKSKYSKIIDNMSLGIHLFSGMVGIHKMRFRVIKFKLNTGEIETLITNVFDKKMTIDDFKALYFRRWGIETHYGELKCKIQIENFSSRTLNGIFQDYYTAIYLYNVIAISKNEIQPIIDEKNKNKNLKYKYKVNFNQAIGIFKDSYILTLLIFDPVEKAKILSQILFLLSKSLAPERPGRSTTRKIPSKAKHYYNLKFNG